jgi:hypothetical protein
LNIDVEVKVAIGYTQPDRQLIQNIQPRSFKQSISSLDDSFVATRSVSHCEQPVRSGAESSSSRGQDMSVASTGMVPASLFVISSKACHKRIPSSWKRTTVSETLFAQTRPTTPPASHRAEPQSCRAKQASSLASDWLPKAASGQMTLVAIEKIAEDTPISYISLLSARLLSDLCTFNEAFQWQPKTGSNGEDPFGGPQPLARDEIA